MKRLRTFLAAILCGSVSLLSQSAKAASFTWANASGNWSSGTSWIGGVAPTGTNPLDVLTFGGGVGVPLAPTVWIASNDFASFRLNQIVLNGTDADPLNSGLQHTIQQNPLTLIGNPANNNYSIIGQAGSANVAINTPIKSTGGMIWDGNGTGTVTINAGISGTGDIVKLDDSTFRFGTMPSLAEPTPGSSNTWMGNLRIGGGVIRYNNNAQAAASALRANMVEFLGPGFLTAKRDGGDENDGVDTSLRMGNLNSAVGVGTIFAGVEGSNTSNYDIVITALQAGDYGGDIQLSAPTGLGQDDGDLVIRGPGSQTFRGNLIIEKDVHVGYGSTMVLAENAQLATTPPGSFARTKGAIIFTGGTLKLDNSLNNLSNGRLRDSDQGSSTVETIGGGMLQLIGNPAGTAELTGRLQLGSGTNLRSGHLDIEVLHNSSTAGTQLTFASYSRNVALQQLTTVEFSARNSIGTPVNLGSSGINPRILLSNPAEAAPFAVPTVNGLLSSTGSGGTPSIGWAVVNSTTGQQFAGYDTVNGVIGIQGSAWAGASSPTLNARVASTLDTAASAPGTPIELNSLRIVPTVNTSVLNITGAGSLSTTAVLLASAFDYAINAPNGGSIAGNGPRYFHVQQANLTVNASVNGSAFPIVKAGDGTLTLTSPSNINLNQVVAINGGSLRAKPGESLPQGEVRLRGGQLEITGGGTFSRNLGYGANTINWSGVIAGTLGDEAVEEDRGSGGFAAVGADVNIDLGLIGPSLLSWEDRGFVRSGYGLVFGSNSATHRVTWTDNLSLSDVDPLVVNYNAREIRVLNNPTSQGDSARISGTISGRLQNDLLKTGSGDLELTGVNTYTGATIVHGGRLLVNDTGDSSLSFLHKVMTGATLGGNGRIGDVLVHTGGVLAPGKGSLIGSVFRTKNLEFFDNSSQFRIELGGISAGGDSASGYDQLQVTGTVTLNGADLVGSLIGGFTPNSSTDLFFLILNDGLDAVVGQFADGNQITISGNTFNISYTADSGLNSMTGGNDVALQFIPEPSSIALMGLGALALVRRRRAAP